MKLFIRALILLTFSYATISSGVTAQENSKKDSKQQEVEQLVNSKNFVFNAQSASPLGSRVIQLTSLYNLRVSSDSLISDLPYFGRAFTAPISPTESPLQFTSTSFDVNVKPRKKGSWDVLIKPGEGKDVRQMSLSVTASGYATLQVISNSRQSISFYGTVTPYKAPS